MSDRTSKTILEADKLLQERREKVGKSTTPYNYDTNVAIGSIEELSASASREKISDNLKTLVQYALKANSPKKEDVSKDDVKDSHNLELASIDTSAISSQEFEHQDYGDNDKNVKEKEENDER